MYLTKAIFYFRALILRPAVVNVIWLLIERGLQIVLMLVIGGLIARNFGPELFGRWQYALTILTIATTLTYICGAETIVPKLVRHSEDSSEILGSAFLIRLFAGFFGFLVAYISVNYFVKDMQTMKFVKILLLIILISEPFAVVVAWFQSRTFIAPVVKIRILSLIVKCVFVALTFILSIDYAFVAVAWFFEILISAVCLIGLYWFMEGPRWKIKRKVVINLLRDGVVYWIGLLFMIGFTRIDRFFIAEGENFSDLGVYSSAMQISETWFTFAGLLSQSFAPKYIYAENSKSIVNRNLKKMLLICMGAACVGSIFVCIFSEILIKIVFGITYINAVPLLRFSIFISIFVFLESVLNSLMLKNRAVKWVLVKWLAAWILAFFIDSFFFRSFGFYGLIFGLCCGYAVACIIDVIYWVLWLRDLNENEL